MKSHSDTVLSVYEGILLDVSAMWPSLEGSTEQDLSYLRRAVEDRGLSFLTITLPSLGKVYDRSLAKGEFLRVEVPQGIPIIQGRPKLFGDLHKLVFDSSGKLWPSPSIEAIFFLRQLCYLVKKFRLECRADLRKEAVLSFFAIERTLPSPRRNTWDSSYPAWSALRGHPLDEDKSQKEHQSGSYLPWGSYATLCRILLSEVGVPDRWELKGGHGPGVVSEQSGFVSKYDFPNWPERLSRYYPYEWFASGRLDDDHSAYTFTEPMSRLISVPKTQKGPRLICAEPLAHQWMQQSIWRWLRDVIPNTTLGGCIKFDSQELSRSRALAASIDGSLCTIDLSEASDRLSCRLVDYVFQVLPDLLDAMHACRTRYLKQTIEPDAPRGCLVRKFAPMGSALTFPIQSIVFATMAIWSVLLTDMEEATASSIRRAAQEVTVFGDDIIVPTRCYAIMLSILESCGLKVNPDKSFSEGNFRESCGMDAYGGHCVTPAYLLETYDGSASSMATMIESSNNFHKKGCWNAAQVIVNLFPEKEQKLLPIIGGDEGGLGFFSFVGPSTAHLRASWCTRYQKEVSTRLTIESKVDRRRGREYSNLTQFFIEDPSDQHPLTRVNWSPGQVTKIRSRKRRIKA